MQRIATQHNERGATAITVALMMFMLAGFTALSVDIGALWSDKKQLQNGADAGALAVAQSCAKGECNPSAVGVMDPKANTYAVENKFDDNAAGRVVAYVPPGADPGEVTVVTESERDSWFANAIGISSSNVSAQATATFGGAPTSLTTPPLAISYCQFYWQNGFFDGMPTSGTPVYIQMMSKPKDFPDTSGNFPCADSNAAHNEAGGGFGWLVTDSQCSAHTSVGGWVGSSTGNTPPSDCSVATLQNIFGTTPGKVVHIPLFDATNGLNGSNAEYQITGYAAIEIGGYCIENHVQMYPDGPCNGDSRHFWGTFVGSSALAGGGAGGTFYGLSVVKLEE